ncbi:MAG: hypothetical protein BM564_08360 [Bacteroidetes bacterium MedPE-SWsnd-G2]|nr:MAG: hypothetical protein BM564_08360 [Bacteroidetes bacterium MedPE-SWsnd-G2]
MKRIYVSILLLLLLFSCEGDALGDCFQKAGHRIVEDVQVSPFSKILVNRDVQLYLKQGETFSVRLETGENLLDDIDIKVVDGQLFLNNYNQCNWVRDDNTTQVYVTAPNITSIRNSSQYVITSEGVLNYPQLELISETFNVNEAFANGDFQLTINSDELSVVSNRVSLFYIDGVVEDLSVRFYDGISRFEGENLIAQNVNIFQRSSNDMVLNPQHILTGEIRGYGNVIVTNQPTIVDVEQFYSGQLIFDLD